MVPHRTDISQSDSPFALSVLVVISIVERVNIANHLPQESSIPITCRHQYFDLTCVARDFVGSLSLLEAHASLIAEEMIIASYNC